MLFTSRALILKAKHISSEKAALTDEHIKMLKRWTLKFQAADLSKQEKIINKAADCIKSIWEEGTGFDIDLVARIRGLSVSLGYSQTCLACLRASIF